MSRPRATVRPVVIGIKLTLQPGIDSDLIALFRHTTRGQRAEIVRGALRGRKAASSEPQPKNDESAEFLVNLLI